MIEMAEAGDNEAQFRKLFASHYGEGNLTGKRRFQSSDATVQVNTDESFTWHDMIALVEIDSSNAAKNILGEYVLLNELTEWGTTPATCLIIVHFFKGYRAQRTTRVISYLNNSLYNGMGLSTAAIAWQDLVIEIQKNDTIDDLMHALIGDGFELSAGRTLAREIQRYDRKSFLERLDRLKWLQETIPNVYYAFHGGFTTLHLFEDMRASYVHGNLIAVVIVGLSFIEHTLAAALTARGMDDAEKMGYQRLLAELAKQGALKHDVVDQLSQLSAIRNRLVHFRSAMSPEEVSQRSFSQQTSVASLWDAEAKQVIEAASLVLARFTDSF